MGFRTGAYAKVWDISPISSTNTKLRISINRKDKKTGAYVPDFSGFVNCVGSASANKALSLKEGSRIKLGDVDVTTKYDKDKKVTYTNYAIFSFEDADSGESSAPQHSVDDGEVEAPDLPF